MEQQSFHVRTKHVMDVVLLAAGWIAAGPDDVGCNLGDTVD